MHACTNVRAHAYAYVNSTKNVSNLHMDWISKQEPTQV